MNGTRKQQTEQTWTAANDARYAELYTLLTNMDCPSENFNACCEFDTLRNKAIACGMDVDPLPF